MEAGRVSILAGTSESMAGGFISLQAGDSMNAGSTVSDGGKASIIGGSGAVGGQIALEGGRGDSTGGSIEMRSGESGYGAGASVSISSSSSDSSDGGMVKMVSGSGAQD